MAKRGRPRICYSYEIASKIAQSEGLSSKGDYIKWWSYNLPARMPKRPDASYRRRPEGFSWNAFLGKGNPFPKRRVKFLDFEQAKEYVSKLGLRTKFDWILFTRTGKKPENIPNRPDLYYKKTLNWISWRDFLSADLLMRHETLIVGKRPLLYIIRLHGKPNNVYKFGMTLDGKESVIELQNKGICKIIGGFYLNKIDDDWLTEITPYINEYMYGDTNEYIVPNIAYLMSILGRTYSQVS